MHFLCERARNVFKFGFSFLFSVLARLKSLPLMARIQTFSPKVALCDWHSLFLFRCCSGCPLCWSEATKKEDGTLSMVIRTCKLSNKHHDARPRPPLQSPKKVFEHGLVNFVPAVAYPFCLIFSAAFSQPGIGLNSEALQASFLRPLIGSGITA